MSDCQYAATSYVIHTVGNVQFISERLQLGSVKISRRESSDTLCMKERERQAGREGDTGKDTTKKDNDRNGKLEGKNERK